LRPSLRPGLALLACAAALASRAAPDEALLGAAQGYPQGPARAQAEHLVAGARPENLVASFSGALESLYPHRQVACGVAATPLPPAAWPAAFTYLHEGRQRSVDDYLARQRVTGLMVVHEGRVEFERYQYGRSAGTRFLSASMAKSLVGLLVGIALQEGRIRSLDDLAAAYVPALAGNPYGETAIRDLLQMSSGVRFAEQYDGSDDLARLIAGTLEQQSPGGAAVLLPYRERRVAAGQLFYYSSADTQALGLVLRGATGMPVADYLATRIWQPMGCEDSASYNIDASGQEASFAFFHARLRDFARLGVLLADGGRAGGRQVVPEAWLASATRSTAPHVQPQIASPYFGYGGQFWTFPGPGHQFALLGVRGQAIFVDPASKLVLVQTAVWKSAGDRAARAELLALWHALVAQHARGTAAGRAGS
jgi:CubicO group peptidase (beta-lactamase class C family)